MSSLNLKPRYLQNLLGIVNMYLPEIEIWAYGSRVNGDAHDASDLDLVAYNPQDPEQRLDNLFEVKEALVESNIPILVDLVDWALITKSMREEIKKSYVIIKKCSVKRICI